MANNGGTYAVQKDDQNNIFDIMRHASATNGPTDSVENLIQIHSRGAIFKRRDFFKKVSIGLLVTLIIVLIAFIIILCFYLNTRSLLSRKSICTSKECIRTASSFRLAMDMSVNPCDDFYQYSCGHWSEEHPNHGWYPKFSNFEFIEERVDMAARKFLRQNNSKDDPLPVKQSRSLYKSCLNIDEQDKLGLTVMYKYLRKANLPLVPSFFNDPGGQIEFDWKKADVDLKRLFDMDLFIGFTVDADVFNRTNNVMYMGAPSAGSPLPSPFKDKRISKKQWRTSTKEANDTTSELTEKVYKNIVSHIIKSVLVNVSTTPIDDLVIENATNILWNISNHIEDLSDINETREEDIKKLLIQDIQKATDEEFKSKNLNVENIWEPYLKLMFSGIPNVTLDLKEKDLIYTTDEDLEYMHKMAAILVKTPNVIVELYTWWSAVQVMVVNTGTEIEEFINKEVAKTKSYSVARLKSLDCAELVIKFMGIAVSYGIAEKAFLNDTKPKVEQMLSDIKTAFVHRVKEITWMDDVTKQVTLEKNKEMMSFIGFPEWLMEKEDVEKYYENITIRNNTYLDNMMEFVSLFFPFRLSSLRDGNEKSWIVDPTTVNAFNYFSENSIYVPMAILTFPMYDLGLEVLNYGSIGSILGHELTHGFDNAGRLYDQYGNYRQWWTNDTIQTFVNKTECFVDQYDSYKIPPLDNHIQGKATLGENIADNGGLHHAYVAYQNYLKTHEPDQKLPGFENFTNNQMFFVAFGSIWCEERNIALLKEQILTDAHCPSQIRVLGTLQNSEDFSKAFACPKGSKMNPNRPKCRIW